MSKPTRPCIFCGRHGLSKEHVWSRWTHDLVPPRPGGAHTKGYDETSPSDPRVVATRQRKNFQGEVNTTKLRVVCKTHCNNGWMSRLDQAVKPILSPLILDQPIALDESRQRTLAHWITTKAMVAEHSRLADVVSLQEDRALVMTSATVPAHWKIWIGRQTGLIWRTGYLRHACTLGYQDEHGDPRPPDNLTRKNTQSITLGIGHLIIHLISTRVPDLHFHFQTPIGRKLRLIHPVAQPLEWPPTDILNGAEIDRIAISFDRYNSKLKWRALPVT